MRRMPRRARKAIPGVPYHIVQRAAHQRFVLESDADKAVFLSKLVGWCKEEGVRVGGFVLMNNHFHLAAESATPTGLGRAIGNACAEFSRFINARLGRRGPNWQSRFWSAPMDPAYAIDALAYIERNPVAAGLCEVAPDWRWSSAAFHCGLGPQPELVTADYRGPLATATAWRERLRGESTPEFRQKLKFATSTGRPLGAESWQAQMEAMLGIGPGRPRGRPRK